MADISYAEMEAMAIGSAPSEYHVSAITPECKYKISERFHVPTVVLDTYLKTENAPAGHIRRNNDGSYDAGPMQINSRNWKLFYDKFKVLPIDIRYNGCINLMVGAYIIRERLDEVGRSNLSGWQALFQVAANYHSKTQEYNRAYQQRWVENFSAILEAR